MVLDPIPQSLPVHFFGSRPQPPTSPSNEQYILSYLRARRNSVCTASVLLSVFSEMIRITRDLKKTCKQELRKTCERDLRKYLKREIHTVISEGEALFCLQLVDLALSYVRTKTYTPDLKKTYKRDLKQTNDRP